MKPWLTLFFLWLSFFKRVVLFFLQESHSHPNYSSSNICKGESLILVIPPPPNFYLCPSEETSGYPLMDLALMCFGLWLHWWIKHLNGFYQLWNVWKNTFLPTHPLYKRKGEPFDLFLVYLVLHFRLLMNLHCFIIPKNTAKQVAF